MNYIQYMKPGNKFWTLPNGLEDVSWSEFWNNWKEAIAKTKEQIADNLENLKQDYKDAADPVAASKRRQAEFIESTRAKQASMKFVSDNRSDYEKKRDVKNLELKEFEQKEQLNKDATDAVMWTLTGIPYAVQHLASPNGVVKTYGNTKAAIQSGGGPYIEKAVASAAGDALDAFIIVSPMIFNEGRQLARELNKTIKNTTLQPTAADEAVLRGQLGWAPKQTIPYRHGSQLGDLKTFVPKHDRWDVTTHGADPYMYFVTDLSTPVSAANMMDLRPYQYTGNIVAEKPMVQVGDFNLAGKNATRNQLISRARQQGADTYLLQDIVDNKVPHLNVAARFIGPEGEAVQGGASSVKWYGPTMGKTTAAKVSDKIVDIDPLLKPIRAKHAERLGLKISDPKVSADPLYKQEVADFVLEWRANPENQGKTLVASTKHLLDPQYKVEFANEPSIPDFETFAARNKARGFKETDEQLRAWYNSILELGRELNIDNKFVSDIEGNTLKGYVFDEVTGEFIPDVATKQALDESLLQMINREATSALLDAAEYFSSPNYLNIISRRGGGGNPELAKQISEAKQLEILNAELEAAHLGKTSERLQGTNERIAGRPNKTTLNVDELNTPLKVRETVYHETGGHGASANIEHVNGTWMNDEAVSNNNALKKENPILALVAEHNLKYRPKDSDLSELGKALRDGDIEKLQTLKEWTGEISTPEQAKEFYTYLVDPNGGMQEIAARVNANRIARFNGNKNTWNESQLLIFTPEYRRKISRYLWGLSPLLLLGNLESEKINNDLQSFKSGGKLNYLNLMGNVR